MSQCLLTLIAPPNMEESLVDFLLNQPNINGFTSHSASGHGSGHTMTLTEQVMGRRQQIGFWIEVEQQFSDILIAELKQQFSGSQLHYWLTTLLASGSI